MPNRRLPPTQSTPVKIEANPAPSMYSDGAVYGLSVVGIGASAGGLDACTRLLSTVKLGSGMAFVLVQHLDPTHVSLMTELLAGRTKLTVREAEDGLSLAADHVYVIPPGTDLSVAGDTLHLSPRRTKPGARLSFDFLLHSLAAAYGPRAACVVLSGTGADGSAGLVAIKDAAGLVIIQDPSEAAYGGDAAKCHRHRPGRSHPAGRRYRHGIDGMAPEQPAGGVAAHSARARSIRRA